MSKELYFECECGGKAKIIYFDCIDKENIFDVSLLSQKIFVCEECGKKYYCGDWEDFCLTEEDL